jgi:hypothetical protein
MGIMIDRERRLWTCSSSPSCTVSPRSSDRLFSGYTDDIEDSLLAADYIDEEVGGGNGGHDAGEGS